MVRSGRFRRHFLWNLVKAPMVTAPAVIGGTLLALNWLTGGSSRFVDFLGISGLLFAAGSVATRWVLLSDRIARSTWEELRGNQQHSHYVYLNRLEARLSMDDDPRTGESIARLRKLYRRMEQSGMVGEDAADSVVIPEIRDRARELYFSCLKSLERTLEFWRAAKEMATESARHEMYQYREQLLHEVDAGVHHLGATLDHLRTRQIKRDSSDENLRRIRSELQLGLDIARNVESRMDELEQAVRQAE